METMVTGKDVRIALSIAGVEVGECDATDFTRTTNLTSIEALPLGKTGSKQQREFRSYSGSITFVVTDGRLDAFEDLYIEAIEQSVDPEIRITETINYVNGTSQTYTYRKVNMEFENRATRGESSQTTVSWESGEVRVPAIDISNFLTT